MTVLSLAQLLTGVVLVSHWAACGFFALARCHSRSWNHDAGQAPTGHKPTTN